MIIIITLIIIIIIIIIVVPTAFTVPFPNPDRCKDTKYPIFLQKAYHNTDTKHMLLALNE